MLMVPQSKYSPDLASTISKLEERWNAAIEEPKTVSKAQLRTLTKKGDSRIGRKCCQKYLISEMGITLKEAK